MIDTNFQTIDRNTSNMAELQLARDIVNTAQAVLERTLMETFPVGAHVRICVAAGPRYSYFTVEKHRKYPSKWMYLKNRNTGRETLHDMSAMGIDLVTYAYEVRDINRALETGSSVIYSMDLETEYREQCRQNRKVVA
jgi:hypothetical protein